MRVHRDVICELTPLTFRKLRHRPGRCLKASDNTIKLIAPTLLLFNLPADFFMLTLCRPVPLFQIAILLLEFILIHRRPGILFYQVLRRTFQQMHFVFNP